MLVRQDSTPGASWPDVFLQEQFMIELRRSGALAVVVFNRPEALNAFNAAAMEALEARLSEVGASDARALIVTGEGDRAFSAGADIKELGERDLAAVKAASLRGQALGNRIERLPMPSIALINGYALGGALELALCCTFRLATVNARMGFPEIKLGVCTGWGGTQRLPRLLRMPDALDLLMTGRTIDAAEAHRIGLVHSVVEGEGLDAARKFAGLFTSNSLLAMRYVREAVTRAADLNLAMGLKVENELSTLSYQSADAREGVAAFLEKREPDFQDR